MCSGWLQGCNYAVKLLWMFLSVAMWLLRCSRLLLGVCFSYLVLKNPASSGHYVQVHPLMCVCIQMFSIAAGRMVNQIT